jgi:MoxR-like ATPase
MQLEDLSNVTHQIRSQIGRAVWGQEDAVHLLLIALLAEGHVLLEGVPGTAKTLLSRVFARTLSLDFRRIQFTPDLMPGDVLGTNLFNFQTNQFFLRKGPIFTAILLADEINRTPPKTQAALLEAMQERRVTIDGETHELSPAFMVVATQNPIEQEGTYPLPEAQLDRFLFRIPVGYPSREAELAMVAVHGNRSATVKLDDFGIEPVLHAEQIEAARELVRTIHLSDAVASYVVDLIRASREHPSLRCGASPRSCNLLASASRARAALDGRTYVLPDDVQELVLPTLSHRVLLSASAEIEGLSCESVIQQVLESVPAPR